uniref:SANT domain-containing protein n=1 Tax=Heterorhabditis bacteriophora TaxID=37862 RepID=A0A1I7X1A0_HETBA
MDTMKRPSSSESGLPIKKIKSQPMVALDDIRKSYLSSQEEKDLRRERGELLLKLFREVPWLAVNESFGSRLEVLTVDKVKKLLTYYKKKDDGSYDNILIIFAKYSRRYGYLAYSKLNNSQLLLEDDPITTCSVPHSINGSVNGDSAENGEDGDDDGIKGLVIIEERTDANKELMDFIAIIILSHSRSAAVNAERHNMWIKITHKANEKFANGLGPLGVEQAKKLFSNCKRRRRVRQEKFGEETQTASVQSLQSHSRDSNSLEPDDINDISSVLDDTSEYNEYSMFLVAPPITNFEDLIRGLDRSVEIDELKRRLADRDTEIERLKKKIIEQSYKMDAEKAKAYIPEPEYFDYTQKDAILYALGGTISSAIFNLYFLVCSFCSLSDFIF